MKKRSSVGKVIYSAVNAILCVGIGAFSALMSPLVTDLREKNIVRYLIDLAAVMILLILAFLIQVIIHESGHLVFGLLSGYRFSSFRVLSFMIKMEDGRPVFKRLRLAGTAGQCIMIPPDLVDGKLPYRLYNLGGAIMNLVSSVLFLTASALLKRAGLGYRYLIVLAMVGIYLALSNAVPVNLTIPNDGYNALFLDKDPNAVKSFWTQLKINQLSGDGVRMKDMPEEWFEIPEDADLNNYLVAYIAVLRENRLMDELRFDQAKELIGRILSEEVSLPELYTALMINDRVYLDLLENGSEADLSPFEQKETAAVLRQMKDFPPVLRTQYAVELLSGRDEDRAREVLNRFEKVALTYPSKADLESERELIRAAEDRAAQMI